jgi:signal transduction histidine kinase
LEERLSFHTELIERIDWLVRLRWLAVVATLAAVFAASTLFPESVSVGPLVAIVAAIAFYNLAFLLLSQLQQARQGVSGRWQRTLALALAQIVLDLLALTALLHLSGGIENPCAMFFVLHVIIASVLLPRRMSFAVAAFASVLYEALALLEYAGVLPHHALPGAATADLYQQLPFLLISIVSVVVTLFAAVYMASSISAQLRTKERELLKTSAATEVRSRELEAVSARLRRIDEERTRFMMLVSHELRAPLNTIYSVLDLATGGYAAPDKSQEMLLRAKRRVTEMLGLINELLMLAKAREEQFTEEERELTPLGDILQDVVRLMRVEAEGQDLFLGVDIAPDVPPVWVNPDRIKLVWTNLLSNAIKYTEPGGIIVASLTANEDVVRGCVRDTGIGIAPEDQPKIFGDFFRAKNARKVSAIGTGIGLSLVKRIIENAGGQMGLKSELGKGSEFFFQLPKGA